MARILQTSVIPPNAKILWTILRITHRHTTMAPQTSWQPRFHTRMQRAHTQSPRLSIRPTATAPQITLSRSLRPQLMNSLSTHAMLKASHNGRNRSAEKAVSKVPRGRNLGGELEQQGRFTRKLWDIGILDLDYEFIVRLSGGSWCCVGKMAQRVHPTL